MITATRLCSNILLSGALLCLQPIFATADATAPAGADKLAPVISPKATPFPLRDVRLLPGPFKERQEIDVRYLLMVEPDRLLSGFRQEAGLQPKGGRYGGWEAREIHGHGLGHYLSAVSIAYAATGDARLLERVSYIVTELAECQQANTNGYVAPMPQRIYRDIHAGKIKAQPFSLNDYWVPNYTLHKIFAGLHDAWHYAGNEQALQIEIKLANWFDEILSGLTPAQIQQMLRTEHGGLLESFADLAAATGDKRYLDLAKKYFHDEKVFAPLMQGEDKLTGLHGNTQIPKIVGLAREYELTGEPLDRTAVTTFWDAVVSNRSYVTGGHGEREHFFAPTNFPQKLTSQTCETCNTYNLLRLSGRLFSWEPSAAQMDFVERGLVNHILANIGRQPGEFGYFLSLSPVAMKVYSTPYDSWWCCVGTGMENPVRYGELVYFHNADTLWVNLFVASEVDWREKGITLRQQTRFPDDDTVHLVFNAQKSAALTLKIRWPAWCARPEVKVNGKAFPLNSRASSYIELDRKWKDGDTVDLRLPMELHLEPLPNSGGAIVAALYGPSVLAGVVPSEPGVADPAKERFSDHLKARLPIGPFPPQMVVDNAADILTHLKPQSGFGEFRSVDLVKPADLAFVPLYRIYEEHYAVYFRTIPPAEWTRRETELRAAEAASKKAEAAIVDVVTPGFQQSEVDHGFKAENSFTGELAGRDRKWRDARDGGWFSYELNVETNLPAALVCTYWGSENGPRTFDILVDGGKIATQTLANNKPGEFLEITYPIPVELLQGKSRVTVKFQAHLGNSAGGVFGCRVVRSQ